MSRGISAGWGLFPKTQQQSFPATCLHVPLTFTSHQAFAQCTAWTSFNLSHSESGFSPGQDSLDLTRRDIDMGSGVYKSRYIGISIPIKYSNFSRFYKKLSRFYKKLRCDKFGNWSTSTRGLLPLKNDEFHETRGLFTFKKWWISWKCALFIKNFLFL